MYALFDFSEAPIDTSYQYLKRPNVGRLSLEVQDLPPNVLHPGTYTIFAPLLHHQSIHSRATAPVGMFLDAREVQRWFKFQDEISKRKILNFYVGLLNISFLYHCAPTANDPISRM